MPIVSGGGGGTFNGGTISSPLTVAPVARQGTYLEIDGASSAAQSDDLILASGNNGAGFIVTSGGAIQLSEVGTSGGLTFQDAVRTQFLLNADGSIQTRGGVVSGALATKAFVSGTGAQVDTSADRFLVVPFTGDATNNAATLLIQLSPDNVTYSTVDTLSIAAALNLTGAINVPVSLYVPALWYVKLTASHGTIGTATYY